MTEAGFQKTLLPRLGTSYMRQNAAGLWHFGGSVNTGKRDRPIQVVMSATAKSILEMPRNS